MAMTEEERRKARNEASKRWYAAHKAQNALNPRSGRKSVKKDPTAETQKRIDKLVKAFAGPVAKTKKLLKEAASLLTDIYRTGDETLVILSAQTLSKGLGLSVTRTEDGKVSVAFASEKTFRVPKTATKPAKDGDVFVPFPPPDGAEPETETKPVEIPVDPSELENVADGQETADIQVTDFDDPLKDDDDEDDDDWDDDDDDWDDDEDDDDDEGDEDDEDGDDADLDGRAEMMREIEAQGGYDD